MDQGNFESFVQYTYSIVVQYICTVHLYSICVYTYMLHLSSVLCFLHEFSSTNFPALCQVHLFTCVLRKPCNACT